MEWEGFHSLLCTFPQCLSFGLWFFTIHEHLNSVSRWLRLCEPDRFLNNAVSLYRAVCDCADKPAFPFSKMRRNGAQPQNEILRKGVWRREPPTSKNSFPAGPPESCFEHLWEQMHCLPSRWHALKYGKAPNISATHAHAIIEKKPDRQDIVCRCQSCYDGITFRFKLV